MLYVTSKRLANRSSCKVQPYAHPRHVGVCSTLYVFDIDVEAILNGSIASTTAL
jgi:hypothetical protein